MSFVFRLAGRVYASWEDSFLHLWSAVYSPWPAWPGGPVLQHWSSVQSVSVKVLDWARTWATSFFHLHFTLHECSDQCCSLCHLCLILYGYSSNKLEKINQKETIFLSSPWLLLDCLMTMDSMLANNRLKPLFRTLTRAGKHTRDMRVTCPGVGRPGPFMWPINGQWLYAPIPCSRPSPPFCLWFSFYTDFISCLPVNKNLSCSVLLHNDLTRQEGIRKEMSLVTLESLRKVSKTKTYNLNLCSLIYRYKPADSLKSTWIVSWVLVYGIVQLLLVIKPHQYLSSLPSSLSVLSSAFLFPPFLPFLGQTLSPSFPLFFCAGYWNQGFAHAEHCVVINPYLHFLLPFQKTFLCKWRIWLVGNKRLNPFHHS